MSDLKFQAVRDDTNPEKFDWDQRKENGQFRGADEGMHVKTLAEKENLSDDEVAMLTDPEFLTRFIKPGDCVLDVVNRAAGLLRAGSSLPPPIGAALPWNRLGLLLYARD